MSGTNKGGRSQEWEQNFCPQKAERIFVEISLVPKLHPMQSIY